MCGLKFTAFVIQNYRRRFWVHAFYTEGELLASLPCRRSLFDYTDVPDWQHGRLIAANATLEGARATLPSAASHIHKLPFPDTIPAGCEIWII